MKFKATPYHSDLLKDNKRLSAFYEAINEHGSNDDVAYDLGCGSGILSYFLKDYFNEIFSVEIDFKAYKCARENLNDFPNVNVINTDVLDYEFPQKADLIVCEMLVIFGVLSAGLPTDTTSSKSVAATTSVASLLRPRILVLIVVS